MNSVTLRIPASTSNLGSGFDTLGLAVNLYNKVTLAKVTASGSSAPDHPPIIKEAARAFFRRSKTSPFPFEVSITGNIPMARGLGASGALRAAIVAGLNQLARAKLPTPTLLEIVTDLEGHPDNASPALLGGCTISGRVGKEIRCLRFPVSPQLKIITLIPNFKVETEQARRLIPQTFSKADTAHSLNRAALITAAFAAKNYPALRGLFDDRLHQPHRLPLVPQLNAVIKAGEKAGAIGGFLSGSGSAIICLTLENAQAVAKAMNSHLPGSEVLVLQSDNRGFQVL